MKWRQETFLGWSFMEREPININLKPNTYLILIHPVAFELRRTCNWVRNKKSQPHPVLWLLTPTSVLLPPCANFPATQWTRLGKWPSSDANMAKSCFRRIEFPTKFTPGCMNAEPRLRRRQEGSAVRNLGHITKLCNCHHFWIQFYLLCPMPVGKIEKKAELKETQWTLAKT